MGADEEDDYSEIQSALSSIGLSAVLIFGATLLSQGLGFLTRVIMARYLPVDGYGDVVIGLSILNLFGLVALAGMPKTISRYIPRQETVDECRGVLVPAFQIVGILSISVSVIIFFSAESLGRVVFGNQNLVWIIQMFAGILPFYAMFKLCVGGFRGYETTYPRIITQNVLRPVFLLGGIVIFVSLGYGTTGIAIAHGAAFVGATVIGIAILLRIGDFDIRGFARRDPTGRYRELLAFSVPIAASGATNVIAQHSDLIILGIIKSSTDVGIYDVTYKMAIFLPLLFTPALGYLFQPIMSRFDANADLRRMDELYTVMTRWLVVAAFPVFALFFIFPEQSLGFIFGTNYQSGKTALQILLIGFMIGLLPGMTGNFLTAVGETKLLMFISVGTMLLNVAANIAFIPEFGIAGAAMATAIARVTYVTLQFYFIHRKYHISPFERNYVVPTVLMTGILLCINLFPVPFAGLNFVAAVAVAVCLGILYIGLFLVTRSVYPVELTLIDRLLEKIGVPFTISGHFDIFVR